MENKHTQSVVFRPQTALVWRPFADSTLLLLGSEAQ